MKGAGQPAGTGDAREVIGQGPVVADVERAFAARQHRVEFGQRQLRLTRAGTAAHAHAKGVALDAPRPGGEAAGDARDQGAGLAGQGANVGIQLQLVHQQPMQSPLWEAGAGSPGGRTAAMRRAS